jgi:hypothetical protein
MDKMVVLVVALLVKLLGQQRVLVIHQVPLLLREIMVEQQFTQSLIMEVEVVVEHQQLELMVRPRQAVMEEMVQPHQSAVVV